MDLSYILNPQEALKSPPPPSPSPSVTSTTGERDTLLTAKRRRRFFKSVYGRTMCTQSSRYPLPVDKEEIKRMELEHRLLRFVYGGKNYVGDVEKVLAKSKRRERRILDCGTGHGFWASEMADEFPDVSVVGVDMAPIQPDEVPQNLSWEIFDLCQGPQLLPYPSEHFDLVHLRCVHVGIRDYPALIREAARVLRPGGMIILAEIDSTPITDAKRAFAKGDAQGWCEFWECYRRCCAKQGIDLAQPSKLRPTLQQTGAFKAVSAQEAVIPVGFWPKDPMLLTIGQLAWMNYDILVESLCPFLLLHSGKSEDEVRQLANHAIQDLYSPDTRPHVCLHIVHAVKA